MTFTNKSLAAGAGLLIFGFLMFQYGLAALLRLDVFLEENNVFSHITSPGILTVMTVSGIIGIVGLLLCFTSIAYDGRRGSKNTQQHFSQLNSNINTLERKIDNTAAQLNQLTLSLHEVKAEALKARCKFCGAKISEQIIFCPTCGKSQM